MNTHLFIGLNWLGDVIMSFPALTLAAQSKGGNNAIEVLTRPHLAPLYAIHPNVSRVWSLPNDRSPFAALALLRRLRHRDFDTITVFPHSFRTALLALLAGGKRRIGYATQGRTPFLHDARPLPGDWKTCHESALHAGLIDAGQSSRPFDPARVDPLPAPVQALEQVTRLKERLSLPGHADIVVMAPGAAFGPAKRWFPERFAALAKRLSSEENLYFCISGTSGEKDLTRSVAQEIGPRARDIGGATSLPELIALLSQARLLVANDSGTMHLAAILGTPVAVAVGSTDMTRTGPLGKRHRLVIGESCSPPCRRPTCGLGTYHCLDSITLDRMERACRELLHDA